MLRYFWVVILGFSAVVGVIDHRIDLVWQNFLQILLLTLRLGAWLSLFLMLWTGFLSWARVLGWMEKVARWVRPVVSRLFATIPRDHPAQTAIVLNISANMLGMGNAATPFGLDAMRQLQIDNPAQTRATNAMCLLLAINTSSVQLVPATAMAVLVMAGDPHPFSIVLPTLVVTSITTLVAITLAKSCARWRWLGGGDDATSIAKPVQQ